MGLLKTFVVAPVVPLRGVLRLAELIDREAVRELTDPTAVARRLEEIEDAWEAGEITDTERDQLEDEVLVPLQER